MYLRTTFLQLIIRFLYQQWDLFVAGILAALSMPGFIWSGFIFIALALLFRRLQHSQHPFRDGWIFGFTFYGISLYWIIYVLGVYSGLPNWALPLVLALLVIYLALFWGGLQFIASKYYGRSYDFVIWAMLVAAAEDLRAIAFSGFPWNPVSLPLTDLTFLAYPASWIGSTGLCFFVALAAALLAKTITAIEKKEGQKQALSLCFGFLAVWLALSFITTPSNTDLATPKMRVALIQGNISQDQKWTANNRNHILNKHLQLSQQAITTTTIPPDLLIWPETALPFYFQQDTPWRQTLIEFIDQNNIPMLVGSPAFEKPTPTGSAINSNKKVRPEIKNRAYLIDEQGNTLDYYDKVHLVPFGEYLPLRQVFSFLADIVDNYGGGAMSPGTAGRKVFAFKQWPLSVVICYEIIFPYEVREFVANGAKILVQLTNDAWFGKTAAPYQHLAFAKLRAIETGIPILRAANTGISAVILSDGTIVEQTALFEDDFIVREITPGQPTFFASFGGFWQYMWLLLGGFLILFAYWHPISKLRSKQTKDL